MFLNLMTHYASSVPLCGDTRVVIQLATINIIILYIHTNINKKTLSNISLGGELFPLNQVLLYKHHSVLLPSYKTYTQYTIAFLLSFLWNRDRGNKDIKYVLDCHNASQDLCTHLWNAQAESNSMSTYMYIVMQ